VTWRKERKTEREGVREEKDEKENGERVVQRKTVPNGAVEGFSSGDKR